MDRKYINPKTLPDWSGMFSQVVVTETQRLRFVHISGQVGVDQNKKLAGDGSLETQAHQALENLKMALACGGATLNDVAKLTIYVVGYQYAQAAVIKEVLASVFPKGRLPALTLIGVEALADKDFLIEIDAEAIAETEPKTKH